MSRPEDGTPSFAADNELPTQRVVYEPAPTLAFGPASSSAASADLRAPAGYVIEKELGRGGMGVVYLARHLRLKRRCALKMILSGAHSNDREIARFRTEAEAVARLQHPGIVQVFEIGEHDGRPFMALEFCAGGSLDAVLAKNPLTAKDAAKLVQSLAEAVQAAHEASVIHRDLKPANVLLASNSSASGSSANGPSASGPREGAESATAEDSASLRTPLAWGVPKITDFGLARKLDEQGQTHTGSVMGTPSYMPPEQAIGTKNVGPAADIYALGAILYECLTGRPPFLAATPLETLQQVIGAEPVAPRELNGDVPLTWRRSV